MENNNKLIKNVIKISKSLNLEENKDFKEILEFLQSFEDKFPQLLKEYEHSNVTFSSFYTDQYSHIELINFFLNNYTGPDKNNQLICFIIYAISKQTTTILEAISEFGEDAKQLLSKEINDLHFFINKFYELAKIYYEEEARKKEQEQEENLNIDFKNHKYKVFFAGYSLEDIKKLDKATTKAVVKKINNYLLDCDKVIGAEGIDHVRDKTNVPMLRIQVANDYRIAFIRYNKMTIILGIELKSGKDANYTRYDHVAEKIHSEIYPQADLFLNNNLNLDNPHYKVLEEIANKLQEKNKKK